MKIRVSTDGMNISVDVGDKAISLFSKIASMLMNNLYLDSNNEVEVEEQKVNFVKQNMELPIPKAEHISNTYNGLAYKGFIYWKCKKCGAIRGFCLKKESKGIHCMSCGDDSLFEEQLKPLYAKCECGKSYKYMTNMDEEMFDMDCIECGSPIPIKWNGRDKCYQTIGD